MGFVKVIGLQKLNPTLKGTEKLRKIDLGLQMVMQMRKQNQMGKRRVKEMQLRFQE